MPPALPKAPLTAGTAGAGAAETEEEGAAEGPVVKEGAAPLLATFEARATALFTAAEAAPVPADAAADAAEEEGLPAATAGTVAAAAAGRERLAEEAGRPPAPAVGSEVEEETKLPCVLLEVWPAGEADEKPEAGPAAEKEVETEVLLLEKASSWLPFLPFCFLAAEVLLPLGLHSSAAAALAAALEEEGLTLSQTAHLRASPALTRVQAEQLHSPSFKEMAGAGAEDEEAEEEGAKEEASAEEAEGPCLLSLPPLAAEERLPEAEERELGEVAEPATAEKEEERAAPPLFLLSLVEIQPEPEDAGAAAELRAEPLPP